MQYPTPGIPIDQVLKHFYYVSPFYFYIINEKSFWSKAFCVNTIVFQGGDNELEFAEKALDLGNR